MKLSFGSAIVAGALMFGGAAVSTSATAAPASKAGINADTSSSTMTDVSAQRRFYGGGYRGGFYRGGYGGPRFGYGRRFGYGPRFGYARPFYRPIGYYGGYRPYRYSYAYRPLYRPAYYRPAYYGGYGYPYGGYGFGPRVGFGVGPVGVSFGGFGW